MDHKLETILIEKVKDYVDCQKLIKILNENDLSNCLYDLIGGSQEKIEELDDKIDKLSDELDDSLGTISGLEDKIEELEIKQLTLF